MLLIIAATHLDAVAFQIFSQSFKLVPTAIFAHWLLGQKLDAMQWASIPVLTIGALPGAAAAPAAGSAGGGSGGPRRPGGGQGGW